MKTTKDHITYWKNRNINWKTSYFDTWQHPHRKLIVEALGHTYGSSLLEVGCGAAANLYAARQQFPGVEVGGVDISAEAIAEAKRQIPDGLFDVQSADSLFFADNSVDVILSDACLIYIEPKLIKKTLSGFKKVARKNIVLCEFHSENPIKRALLRYKTGYFAHNYRKLLSELGFYDIEITKIPKEAWPGTPWEEWGYIIQARIS